MTPDLTTCPRCRGEDNVVMTIDNYPGGSRVVHACDACGATFQTWAPRPTAGAR